MQNQNIHRLLAGLKNVQEHDGYYTALCPVHDDQNNSLSVTATDDEKILVKCHTGCDAKQIVYSAGLTWSDMFPPRESRKQVNRKIVATYDYYDTDGVLVYQVCRLEEDKNGKVTKTFQQRRPDGKGGWTWKTKGLSKVLYRLPELMAAPKDNPVFVVEGEKQVDFLRNIGLVATCNTGGAGKWLKTYGRILAERDVVVVPDCDPPNEKTGKIVGAAHAVQVADSCLPHANSVHVVQLPNCQPKWGLDDWLQLGGNSVQDLKKILEETPQYPEGEIITEVTPQVEENMEDADAVDWKILNQIGIVHVCRHEPSGYEVFSEHTKRFSQLPPQFSYSDLLNAGGRPVRMKVQETNDDSGDYAFRDIKNAIALLSADTEPIEHKRGQGVWPVDESRIAIVSKGQLVTLNGRRTLNYTSSPILNEHVYDIGEASEWVDLDLLEGDLKVEGPVHRETIDSVVEFISTWTFRYAGFRQAELITGLMLASIVQPCWKIRPQVFLTGQSYSGKTVLIQNIEKILKKIAERMSGPSAAGIRAFIKETAKIAMLDELEKSKHRKEVFEMLRAAARGDSIVRSSASQKLKKFSMNNIFWCAAIESGVIDEADKTRFITIELAKGDSKPDPVPSAKLEEWGDKLVRAALCSHNAAKALIEAMSLHPYSTRHGRLNECYAVPAAAYAAAMGMGEEEAVAVYHQMMGVVNEDEEIELDYARVVSELLHADVRLDNGSTQTVYELLHSEFESDRRVLRVNGINRDHEFHYFNRQLLMKQILDKRAWSGVRLDLLLLHIPGAERSRTRLVGVSSNPNRCIRVPNEEIEKILGGEKQVDPEPNPFGFIGT